jgi:hypothetical protein
LPIAAVYGVAACQSRPEHFALAASKIPPNSERQSMSSILFDPANLLNIAALMLKFS